MTRRFRNPGSLACHMADTTQGGRSRYGLRRPRKWSGNIYAMIALGALLIWPLLWLMATLEGWFA